jgi:hypothetical protein
MVHQENYLCPITPEENSVTRMKEIEVFGAGGTQTCAGCEEGKYNAVAGPKFCLTCPDNAVSAVGSDALQDCLCAQGYSGADGGSCSPCAAGTYKDVASTTCMPFQNAILAC